MTSTPSITLDVADGVHAVRHAGTSCYVVEGDEGVTLVDAAYRSTWHAVRRCLWMLGRPAADVRGLVLTGGGSSHDGYAGLLRRCYGVPVLAGDAHPASRGRRSWRQGRALVAAAAHPQAWPLLRAMAADGARLATVVVPDHRVAGRTVLPLPGAPELVPLPSGPPGACLVHLPDRRTVLTGRAVMTPDPTTRRRHPRLVVRDPRVLETIRSLDADVLLPRFGQSWRLGTERAADPARAA